MGQQGRVAFRLQAEDVLLQVGRCGEEGHFHQHPAAREGKQFAIVELVSESIIQEVFGGGMEIDGDIGVFLNGIGDGVKGVEDGFRGVRIQIVHHVWRSNELAKAQLLQFADEFKAFVQILCTIVNTGQEMGMKVYAEKAIVF